MAQPPATAASASAERESMPAPEPSPPASRCEVVVINYRRPANLPVILQAFRQQTVPVTVTLCDVHPSAAYALDAALLRRFDKVYRWEHNRGGFNRFIPGFGLEAEYVYFHDDDMAPGPQAIACLLHFAGVLENFGVLGQLGRLFPGGRFNCTDVRAESAPRLVDAVVRGYFLRTQNLVHLWQTIARVERDPACLRHDDLLLCMAMRHAGLPNYAVPARQPEERIDQTRLPDAYALSMANPAEHARSRQDVLTRYFFARPAKAAAAEIGIVYLSMGAGRRGYLAGALASAERWARLPVHAFSDHPAPAPVTLLDPSRHNRWYKTSMLLRSPFPISVLLDDDTRFEAPFDSRLVTEALAGSDLALVVDYFRPTLGQVFAHFHRAAGPAGEECAYMIEQGFPPDTPHFNSGVIFVRRTPATENFFLTWFQEWARFRTIDQLALCRALRATGITPARLDLTYNLPAHLQPGHCRIRHFYGRFARGKSVALATYDQSLLAPSARAKVNRRLLRA